MTNPILIDNAAICDAGAETRAGSVLVEGTSITAVAFADDDRRDLRARAAEIVDATGHWLMPGMVDAHAHSYGALLRGTEGSLPLELWALHTTLYGRAMDGPALRAAVLLGAAERMRGGITGLIDHSPMVGFAGISIAAHEASGLRVGYAPFLHDVSDYDLLDLKLPAALAPLTPPPPPVDEDAYAANFASLVATARGGSGRVQVQLGPNAPQRCSPSVWKLWRALRDRHDVAVHTHLLETRAQASLNHLWPGGMVAAMAREGMLEGRLTCAHGVWLTDAEREVLAAHDVTVSHNPASNLMLGSGVMPLPACRACGLRVALGTDSANTGGRHDLWGVMRLAMMLPRRDGGDPAGWPTGLEMFSLATEAGAASLGLHGRVGRIAAGQLADLALVRRQAAGTLAFDGGIDAMVRHAGPEAVDSVMVDGVWTLRSGRILAFDEAAVLTDAADQIARLRARMATQLPVLLAAMPDVTRRFLAASRDGFRRREGIGEASPGG